MSSQPWWAQYRRDGAERERFLAISCAVLGTGCVGITYLAPRLLGPHLNIARVLLFAYLAYSSVSLLTTTVYRSSSSAWRWCMHATGVASICLLTMSTGGAHSPFLILYLLALLTAAELWGMRGTLITSFACAVLLLLPPLASAWTGRILPFYEAGSSMKGAIALSGSLIMASYLLGFLAEEAKRRHVNALIISRLIGNGLPEIGLRTTLERLLYFIGDFFEADQVKLVLRRVAGDDAFLWEAKRPRGAGEATVRFSNLSDTERRAYFAALPESVWRAVQRRCPLDHPVDPRGAGSSSRDARSKSGSSRAAGRFRALHNFGRESVAMRVVGERHTPFVDFSSLLAVSFSYQQNWFGRLLVYNSARGAFHKRDVRLLESLVREVAPAIQYMHDLGRLRSRAQAAERTRLAHELHDGVIQSLMGLEMQTEARACFFRQRDDGQRHSVSPQPLDHDAKVAETYDAGSH